MKAKKLNITGETKTAHMMRKKAAPKCRVTHVTGITEDMPFRHFCGGTSIRLPYRLNGRHWHPLNRLPRVGVIAIGEVIVKEIEFPKSV